MQDMDEQISAGQCANKKRVTVQSSARLHMGFFDLHGGLGRKFGSIGLSLEAPCLEVSACHSAAFGVTGMPSVPSSVLAKVSDVARQITSKLHVPEDCSFCVEQTIPEHAGLGSGTQLALAAGIAISRLYGLNLNAMQIAQITGRGNRSGIGIAAFERGGVLVDGGRITGSANPPPLLARYDFPEAWRVLLILDAHQPGIHGEAELLAFQQLPAFSESLAAHLCRHMLMQVMPALVEHDLNAFGCGIQVLQQHVGDYFAPAQGGRYASERVGAVLQRLESMGVACFGQSSWGPTGFAVFENAQMAQHYLQQLQAEFAHKTAVTFVVTQARNCGAVIKGTSD